MKARLLLQDRVALGDDRFGELVVWELPRPVPGCRHRFKYRLAFVVRGVCVVRFDNETGKGDHKHIYDEEVGYVFRNSDRLLADFWQEIDMWSEN
jgi:Family of unknown function (DUF6516)